MEAGPCPCVIGRQSWPWFSLGLWSWEEWEEGEEGEEGGAGA